MQKPESFDLNSFEDAFNDALIAMQQENLDDVSQGNDIVIVIKTNGKYTLGGQMRTNSRVYINASNQDVANDLMNDVEF